MISKEQIAHDLAVAKLCSSDLPVKELCKKYKEYYTEILDYLKSAPTETPKATIMKSPF